MSLRFKISIQNSLIKALIRSVPGGPGGNYKIELGKLGMPHPVLLSDDIIAQNGPIFFFGAIMFGVVINLGSIVIEKENGITTPIF